MDILICPQNDVNSTIFLFFKFLCIFRKAFQIFLKQFNQDLSQLLPYSLIYSFNQILSNWTIQKKMM
jgi:hypothetical protein